MFFFTRRKETILAIFFHNLLFMMYLSVVFRTKFCKGWEGIFEGGLGLGKGHGESTFLWSVTICLFVLLKMTNAI